MLSDPPVPDIPPTLPRHDVSETNVSDLDLNNLRPTGGISGSTDRLNTDRAPKLPPNRQERPPLNVGHQTSSQKEEYIPLETCFSGPAGIVDDDDQVFSSIPLDIAPPTPAKTGEKKLISDDGNGQTYDQPSNCYRPAKQELDNNDNLYKLPPPNHPSVLNYSPEESNVYKYPPAQKVVNQQNVFNMVPPPQNNSFIGTHSTSRSSKHSSADDDDDEDDVYKVPPVRHEQVEYDTPPIKPNKVFHNIAERDSGSSGASKNSFAHTDDSGFVDTTNQQFVKNSVDSLSQKVNSMNMGPSQDIYDTPPSSKSSLLEVIPPPPRPHKGPVDPKTDSRYINLPSNSKSHPDKTPSKNSDNSYDFPVSANDRPQKTADAKMLGMSPPPPGDHKGVVLHRYTNAPPGYIPASTTEHDSYMPMTSPTTPTRNAFGVIDSSYLPMDNNSKQSYGDSYLSMDRQESHNQGNSYLPMAMAGSPPSDSYSTAPQRQSDRTSNGSIYAVMPDGPPRQYNPEYDNRFSDIYSGYPSNRPVSEDIYAPPPSNRPVEKGLLNTYLPPPSQRDSDVYALPPSNKPVTLGNSQVSMLEQYATVPSQTNLRDSTYDTPPPRPGYKARIGTSSPRFKPKGNNFIYIII